MLADHLEKYWFMIYNLCCCTLLLDTIGWIWSSMFGIKASLRLCWLESQSIMTVKNLELLCKNRWDYGVVGWHRRFVKSDEWCRYLFAWYFKGCSAYQVGRVAVKPALTTQRLSKIYGKLCVYLFESRDRIAVLPRSDGLFVGNTLDFQS